MNKLLPQLNITDLPSQLNISDLPDEILLHIFHLVDEPTKLYLVSKRWNKVWYELIIDENKFFIKLVTYNFIEPKYRSKTNNIIIFKTIKNYFLYPNDKFTKNTKWLYLKNIFRYNNQNSMYYDIVSSLHFIPINLIKFLIMKCNLRPAIRDKLYGKFNDYIKKHWVSAKVNYKKYNIILKKIITMIKLINYEDVSETNMSLKLKLYSEILWNINLELNFINNNHITNNNLKIKILEKYKIKIKEEMKKILN